MACRRMENLLRQLPAPAFVIGLPDAPIVTFKLVAREALRMAVEEREVRIGAVTEGNRKPGVCLALAPERVRLNLAGHALQALFSIHVRFAIAIPDQLGEFGALAEQEREFAERGVVFSNRFVIDAVGIDEVHRSSADRIISPLFITARISRRRAGEHVVRKLVQRIEQGNPGVAAPARRGRRYIIIIIVGVTDGNLTDALHV